MKNYNEIKNEEIITGAIILAIILWGIGLFLLS